MDIDLWQRQSAADELAHRLKDLADDLGTTLRLQRIDYSLGGFRNIFKSRSPAGYVVAPLCLLLPDGRLWTYSRADADRFPCGRSYDARHDHAVYASARTFFGGIEFRFLGAVLGKYSFGIAELDRSRGSAGLCALVSEGTSAYYLKPDEAFEKLATSLLALGFLIT